MLGVGSSFGGSDGGLGVVRRVTIGLCLVAAAIGLIAGINREVTETQVIRAGAALYVAETGGSELECVGRPGLGAVWIEVRCGVGAQTRVYAFDRQGGLISQQEGPTA